MRATTTILAYVIAFAAVAFIAAGVWDFLPCGPIRAKCLSRVITHQGYKR